MSLLEALYAIGGGIISIALLAWRICWTTKRDVEEILGGRGKNYGNNS